MNSRALSAVLLIALLSIGCRSKPKELDLFSDDRAEREKAIALLTAAKKEKQVVIMGVMMENLSHEDSRRVSRATDVLVALKRLPVATLRAKLKDPDPFMRITAATTLGRIGWYDARPALPDIVELTRDPHPLVRAEAAHALALAGAQTLEAQKALMALTTDENADVRSAASQALATLRPERFGSPAQGKM